MRTSARAIAIAFAVGASFAPFGARAVFDSGSSGADGAFNPTVNTTLQLPPSGIFNFTSVNIPSTVTVTFTRNTTNTPVVFLATGNVTVAGTINLNGGDAIPVGAAGGGALGDDGQPGAGAVGGFAGGRGGSFGPFATSAAAQSTATATLGSSGLGPGGGGAGGPSTTYCFCNRVAGGAGGGYSSAGAASSGFGDGTCGGYNLNGSSGAAYGTSSLLPLIGGSGGGGGSGGTSFSGAGGGGGGGALLIAASGTISVTGTINANGGRGGDSQGPGMGGPGGGGSGGAIRLVATTVSGNGPINAAAGAIGNDLGSSGYCVNGSGAGAPGRIRIEAEVFQRTASTNPPLPAGSVAPAPVFIAGTPTLRIASVAGVSAPATPSGNADITLPASTPNPVAVVFETTGVPVGNIVQLTVVPASGAARVVAVTPALTGSTASATASVSVNLPSGPSTLSAQTTYTVVADIGDLLKNFAGNERVEKVTLMATLGGPSRVKLITVSGKEYEAPAEVLRIAGLGG